MESTNTKTLGEVNTISYKANEKNKIVSFEKGQSIKAYENVRGNEQEIVGINPIVIELARNVQLENSRDEK